MNNGFYEFSRGRQETTTTSSVFPYTGSAIITGSLIVSGSVISTEGFTGSLFGTSSWAISASWAPTQTIDTSSLVTTSSFNAFTSSYNTGSFTGSFTGTLIGTSSWAINVITASYASNGGVTQLLAGPNVTLSPASGLGQVTVSATLSGSTIFNTATGSYGSFYDTTTQTNPVANIPRSMSLNETDISNGVSVSGSTNPFNTYIKTQNAGVYNIQFSAQVEKTDSGTDVITIWLRKNGIDLTDSATKLTLSGNSTKVVAAWNWFVSSAANDYYQIIWVSADTGMRLYAEPINDTPGIPSVIVTANRVDQFLSNTGSFSGSFTGQFTGSLFGTASFASTASFVSPTTTNAFVQGGNSFGATALLGTNDNQSLALETSGSTRMFISSSGDIGIGTITPSSKLQVNTNSLGTTQTDASGITLENSTLSTAGTYQNSPGLLFSSRGWGQTTGDRLVKWRIYSQPFNGGVTEVVPRLNIDFSVGGGAYVDSGFNINRDRFGTFFLNAPSISTNSISGLSSLSILKSNPVNITPQLTIGNPSTHTTGTTQALLSTAGFSPTSGTGVFNIFEYSGSINQTGGANGITRGLFINPTLTSASDWRAIEVTRGNNLLNSTSGNTYVGLSTNTGTARLQVRGTGATSSTNTLLLQNSSLTDLLTVRDDGSTILSGSINVTQGITGSLFGTSSWAVSASWAPSTAIRVSSITLTSGSWSLVSGYYQSTYTNANIVSTGYVDFTPNNASALEVTSCKMLPEITANSGNCVFYSQFPPQSDIIGQLIINVL
jgi:hypothetical protein